MNVLVTNCLLAVGINNSIMAAWCLAVGRLLIFTSLLIDCCRSLALLLYCWILVFTRAFRNMSFLLTLTTKNSTYNNVKMTYISIYLFFVSICGQCIQRLTYIWLYTGFWVTVAASWLIPTKSPSSISYPMYFSSISVPLIFTMCCYVMFPLVCSFLEDSARFVSLHQFSSALA